MSANLAELTMPKWGLTMEEGTLVQWLIEEGTEIELGMAIAEVETDKIVNVLEATQTGILVRKVAGENETLPVGALLGVIAKASVSDGDVDSFVASFGGGDASAADSAQEASAPPAAGAAAPAGIQTLTMPKWGLTMEEGTLVQWLVEEGAPIVPGMAVAEVETDKIVNVMESPCAGVLRKKIATDGDVLPVGADLAVVAEVEVTDAQIEAFLAGGAQAPAEQSASGSQEAPAAAAVATPAETLQPLQGMRAAIAKTVTNSWTTIPHYMVTVAIDMGAAESACRALKEKGTKVSINDILIKGCAVALQKFPLLNASYAEKNIALHADVNMAVAVGLDDGVIMPVIRKCQELPATEIGVKSRELVGLAKEGKLGKEELSGGTFAISNMGMLGVEDFIAIVPPGLSAILAVGKVKDEVVAKNGEVGIARTMRVTISADHRVHDGAYAAKYLAELKSIMEAPDALLS
ncbi:2-oxo acid dehydrogenase subunit E2 [Geomonas sp. RF6]|uniref:dihydrolipoamide acetyltransferase family protein n=1 Tax=Geomonas sp. RF6 TaxID=2897342 RepID=UPI001E4616C7|nr:dihydrolipoamide acetyltransferase family protein [Geomonas sp. RF6]UFS70670.1 2-oxo acid dehydrogenase subunit E2 [Geomonas sp. RF6]